ncbi:MAG TPA: NADH-quinone oxidoreductase subunit NuoH [Fibrobacteria bacterium]|nr:NADH-quinone oxidoreductase subunit NuoH [Fibrobacteria bacterium]
MTAMQEYAVNHPVGDLVRRLLPGPWAAVANGAIAVAVIAGLVTVSAIFLIWLERKVCAHFQARLGPTRVGPMGLLQPVADAIKLLMKENLRPRGVDGLAYFLAPLLPITGSFLVLAVMPFDHDLQVVDLEAGVVYVVAVSGLGILGILIGGWGSNNKYSLLGSMRSGAQLFSYELSMVLCMLLIVMASGSASLREIVLAQQGTVADWWIFKLPVAGFLAFALFMISSTAELNRGPLDLSEAESELTGGFHTEYAGISFSMFFLAEFVNMFASAGLGATFFLGGFLAPRFGIGPLDAVLGFVPGVIWFFLKAYVLIFLYMWFRWTFPRLRIDHLLSLEWKFLLPVSMANLLLAATLVTFKLIIP